MPKIKMFLWQLCHNALPIRGTLLRRGCLIEPQCPLCLNDIETTDHLFGACSQTIIVWELARLQNWHPKQTQIFRSQEWLQVFGTLKNVCTKKTLQRISILLWSIWKIVNATIFQNETFQPIKCFIRAKKLSAEWRIRTCLSVHSGDFFYPFKKKFINLLDGNPLTQGGLNSILMVPSKATQQQEATFSVIGKEQF